MRRAFTLIELLVVVAIIGLLLAIFLPALVQARDRVAKQVCDSQLHQLSLALKAYHEENDCLPRASYLPSVSPAPLETEHPIFIADVLCRLVGDQTRVFHCPKDVPDWSEREPPNTGKSYFQSERSSYFYPNVNLRMLEYEPFHD